MTTILECGHEPTPDAGCGTGYATDRETGRRSCYACSDNLEREAMGTAERFFAYLSSDGRTVTTWSGGKLGTILRLSQNLPEPAGIHFTSYAEARIEAQVRSETDMFAWADWAGAVIRYKVSRVNPSVTTLSLELDYDTPVRLFGSIPTVTVEEAVS
jgi:hypothetical protein